MVYFEINWKFYIIINLFSINIDSLTFVITEQSKTWLSNLYNEWKNILLTFAKLIFLNMIFLSFVLLFL